MRRCVRCQRNRRCVRPRRRSCVRRLLQSCVRRRHRRSRLRPRLQNYAPLCHLREYAFSCFLCAIRCAKELMGTTFFNFTRNCSCRIRPHKRLTCVLSAIAGSARQWHYDAPCTKLAFCMRQAHHHCTTKARKGKEVSDNWTWNSRAGFAMRTGGLPHGKSNQKRQGASIRPCFDGRRYFKASSRTVV